MPSTSIEIRTHAQRHVYRPVPAARVPTQLRWDVPKPNQGQIVEVAYADTPRTETRRVTLASGETISETVTGAPHGEAGPGSRYRRTVDRSDGSATYEERA